MELSFNDVFFFKFGSASQGYVSRSNVGRDLSTPSNKCNPMQKTQDTRLDGRKNVTKMIILP